MRSKLLVLLLAASSGFAQNRIDSHSKMHITFPEDSPVSVVSGDWGESSGSARGGAMLLDLHTSLSLKNTGSKRIRGVTLLVLAQDVTPGGKASVTIPSLNVATGETFPVRIDLRLLRPLEVGSGPLVEILLDGVLFEDLSFYGSDRLNSRRSMTVWELEARRDRKYFKDQLDKGGPEQLRTELLASMQRQADRSTMDARVQHVGRATNFSSERQVSLAFMSMPNAPVEILGGRAGLADNQARIPAITVANKSDKAIRTLEVGWMVKDQSGKSFMTGVVPLDVNLGARQSTTVLQDSAYKFSQANGAPVRIDTLSGFVNSVEYSDGRMWVPDRNSSAPNPSPEEQRLSQIYRKKGLQAVVEELKKF